MFLRLMSSHGWPRRCFAVSAVLLVAWRANNASAESTPTYYDDIAPLFARHCVECHRAGQIGPMPLTKFREVRPWAKSIRNKVTSREMPPWFASESSLEFQNENRLSEEAIARVTAWVEGGAPSGQKTVDASSVQPDESQWRIGEPDAVFSMQKPYLLSDEVEDIQERLIIPTGLRQDRWVSAIEVRPGNAAVLHHMTVLAGSAPLGAQDGRRTPSSMLFVYAPGSPPYVYASGHGKLLKAGTQLTLSLHYHKARGEGTATSDLSQIGVKFARHPVEHPVTTAWVINRDLNIPPGESMYRSVASMTFLDDGHLFSFFPHMHYRGKSINYRAHYPNGKVETLLDVPRFDFNWQLWYLLREPKSIPKGTRIEVIAHHDNSAENGSNPDPYIRVRWGGAASDEMMIGYFDYTYETLKSKQTDFPGRLGKSRSGDPAE